jgi:hypothetical protein
MKRLRQRRRRWNVAPITQKLTLRLHGGNAVTTRSSISVGPARVVSLYCGRRRRQEGVETLLDDGIAFA